MRYIFKPTFIIVILSATLSSASATEIDFSQVLTDLDGKVYRDCVKPNANKIDCDEWIEHTLGLISYGALDRPEKGINLMDQARRAVLARKVYPGRNEKHVVDLSASEITLIVDQIGKMELRPVELLRIVEILDPARLKDK